jgi:CheY-like chemotaxis protein
LQQTYTRAALNERSLHVAHALDRAQGDGMGLIASTRPRSRRILLADDNEVLQAAVERLAELRGHQVIRATTGASTLTIAIDAQPDLIVLDMAFPDADGRDILLKLKRDERTAKIPVLVWSGRTDPGSESRISLDLGAEDHMEKAGAQPLLLKIERMMLRLDSERDQASTEASQTSSGYWRTTPSR